MNSKNKSSSPERLCQRGDVCPQLEQLPDYSWLTILDLGLLFTHQGYQRHFDEWTFQTYCLDSAL